MSIYLSSTILPSSIPIYIYNTPLVTKPHNKSVIIILLLVGSIGGNSKIRINVFTRRLRIVRCCGYISCTNPGVRRPSRNDTEVVYQYVRQTHTKTRMLTRT